MERPSPPAVRYPGPSEDQPLLIEEGEDEYDPFAETGELKGGCDLFEFIFELAGLALMVIAGLILFLAFYSDWQEAGIKPEGAVVEQRMCTVQHCGERLPPLPPAEHVIPTQSPDLVNPTDDTPIAFIELQSAVRARRHHALQAQRARDPHEMTSENTDSAKLWDEMGGHEENQEKMNSGDTVQEAAPEVPVERSWADSQGDRLKTWGSSVSADTKAWTDKQKADTKAWTDKQKAALAPADIKRAHGHGKSYIFATMNPEKAHPESNDPNDLTLGGIMFIKDSCEARTSHKLGEEFPCFFSQQRTSTGALEVYARPGWVRTRDDEYHHVLSRENPDNEQKRLLAAFSNTIYVYPHAEALELEEDKEKTHMSSEFCPAAVPVALVVLYAGFTLACCLNWKGMLGLLLVGTAVYLSNTQPESPWVGWYRCDLSMSVMKAQSATDTFQNDIAAVHETVKEKVF